MKREGSLFSSSFSFSIYFHAMDSAFAFVSEAPRDGS